MKWIKKLYLLFAIFTMCYSSSFAQKAKYQVDIIYRLSKHITWPETVNDSKFVIGVLGSKKDFQSFQELAVNKSGYKKSPMEVRYFENNDAIEDCQILYISKEYTMEIRDVLKKTKNQPVLIISDEEGYGELGSVINFVDTEGKLKFELNQAQADKRGLQVSEKLKKIAIII